MNQDISRCMLHALLIIPLLWIHANALWPMPQDISAGTTPLRLSDGFSILVSGFSAPSDLKDAITRTKLFVINDKLGPLTIDRGTSMVPIVRTAKVLSHLTVSINSRTVNSIATEAQKHIEERDESYILEVPNDGSGATLMANTTLGLFRGLTTFSQLWFTAGGQTFMTQAPLRISDSPAYPYRGLLFDTSRNFFPVEDIKRTLDAMSWVKINTLHWHVVDSQSFPLQVPGFTELSDKGAYSASSVYTTSDVADIVEYAGSRGIDILVEIDTPGHEAAISKSHPEHIACNEATPWSQFANEPPAGQLRIANPATVNFTANLVSSVASMFPSTMMSTGGDEININCYNLDNETQRNLESSGETLEQALNTFIGTLHLAIGKKGKTPVVKEEIVLTHNVTLLNSTVVLVWISSNDVASVAQKGFRLIHCASDYFYLDCGGGGWVGNNPQGNSWCDPFKTWQRSYSFEPTAGLTPDQVKLVLGGQQLLWTEQSGPSNLDPIVWPRAAASAEVFWTGITESNRNISSALPRLHEIAFRMQARGVNAIPLQPLWCALRPGACDVDA